jgi:phosphopantothenoylcysteine decarboxylase / phosphopantothenate---cysteine ligase
MAQTERDAIRVMCSAKPARFFIFGFYLFSFDFTYYCFNVPMGWKGRLFVKILVTAGPTAEDIDDIRFITNRSSGKMGYAIAETAANRGHSVVLISGPVALPPASGARMRPVRGAREMCDAVLEEFPSCDVLIMAAAVADFTPAERIPGKYHKNQDDSTGEWVLRLVRTPDILKAVQPLKGKGQRIVGFSLEPKIDVKRAEGKLSGKKLDAIVANDTSSFQSEKGRFWILFADAPPVELGIMSKKELSEKLLNWLESGMIL